MKLSYDNDRKRASSTRLAPVFLVAMALIFPAFAFAQNDQGTGKVQSGYEVHQSVEVGGHIADWDGSTSLWDTFVNLNTGPRLLEQSLDLHSVAHNGLLFDDLSTNSFGWGGDPNNVTNLRMSKGHWYTFNASFRRDRNYWDYDLLANPLNPAAPLSNPARPVLFSPHLFDTVRRNTDLNLTILPESKVRFRIGYNRNVSEGGSFSSVHTGTDALLDQQWRNGLDAWSAGVDLRFIPRTTISYDQFFFFYRGDTSWFDQLNAPGNNKLSGLPFLAGTFFLANGNQVDLGLPFNTAAGQPCATPILGTGLVNPACNGYLAYTRTAPTRSSYPTEQFSFQSNYWKKLDLSGRVSYTGADSYVSGWDEFFKGMVTRDRTRLSSVTGPSNAQRVTSNVDFGVTFHITDNVRFVDNFRWANFRIPGVWYEAAYSLFGANLATNPNVYSPATCPPPFTAATCPQHLSGSGPDGTQEVWSESLSQDLEVNTIGFEYDVRRWLGVSGGWRWRHRDIRTSSFEFAALTFLPNNARRGACSTGIVEPGTGICRVVTFNGAPLTATTDFVPEVESVPINENSGLFGFWIRPSPKFRLSYDLEVMRADNAFTRISPRDYDQNKLRVNYKPMDWLAFSGALNWVEAKNEEPADVAHREHNRNVSVATVINPNDKFGFDLSYNYDDIFSTTNICFVATPVPTLATTSCGTPFLAAPSVYQSNEHFGALNFYVHPIKRVTATAGYTLTSTSGSSLVLNQNQPTGPLNFNYQLPSASVAVDLVKNWTFKTGWNYYDYNEKSAAGPTLPRDVNGNVVTLAIRYSY